MKEYQSEHKEAESDITAYLSNPINAYLLTKRLTSDWVTLENIMSYDVGGGMFSSSFNKLVTTLYTNFFEKQNSSFF